MANTSHVSDQAHNAKECCKNLPAAFLGEDVKRDKSTVKRKSCSDFSLLALSLITPYASHMTIPSNFFNSSINNAPGQAIHKMETRIAQKERHHISQGVSLNYLHLIVLCCQHPKPCMNRINRNARFLFKKIQDF